MPKIGVRIIIDSEQLVKISTEQFEILEDLEINSRVVVSGYAGTGKNLLAQEHARRKESIGEEVLFCATTKHWLRK